MKKNLFEEIERERKKLIEMSDFIFEIQNMEERR